MRPFWLLVVGVGVMYFIASGKAQAALQVLTMPPPSGSQSNGNQ